jgi:hypothetical protein
MYTLIFMSNAAQVRMALRLWMEARATTTGELRTMLIIKVRTSTLLSHSLKPQQCVLDPQDLYDEARQCGASPDISPDKAAAAAAAALAGRPPSAQPGDNDGGHPAGNASSLYSPIGVACFHCGARAPVGGPQFPRCVKCRLAAYCGKQCQVHGDIVDHCNSLFTVKYLLR